MAGLISDAVPPTPADLMRRIMNLERLVQQLAAGRSLENATIAQGGISVVGEGAITTDGGSVVVKDGTTEIARFGDLHGVAPDKADGSHQVGWIMRRSSGELAGFCDTNVAGGLQSWSWTARDGNGVVADDAVSGVNLARPYIPIVSKGNANTGQWATTTSTSFAQLELYPFYRQHAQVIAFVGVWASAADTTGEVKIVQDGNLVGTVQTVNNTPATLTIGPVAWPVGGNTTFHNLQLMGRVTAGTGNVGASILTAWGVQS